MSTLAEYIAKKRRKEPKMRIGSLRTIHSAQVLPPIPTGNLVADYVTSVGGFPRGVITEVRGAESSGKTTLCAMAAASHQKAVREGRESGAILYLDFENAVDAAYFSALGVDVDDSSTFVYMQPDNLEQGINIALEMIKEDYLAMVIIDSVAAASGAKEQEEVAGKVTVAQKAKIISQGLRLFVTPLKVHGVALVLINHVQKSIPTGYGEISREISPGGTAIAYYPSIRLNLSRPTRNKAEQKDELTNKMIKQVTSTDVVITAFKNKLGTPERQGKMRVRFGKGFDQIYAAFHILVDHSVIKKGTAGRFTFPEKLMPSSEKVPVGADNIVDALHKDPEWAEKVVKVAQELVNKFQENQNDVEVVVDEENIDLETGEVLDD